MLARVFALVTLGLKKKSLLSVAILLWRVVRDFYCGFLLGTFTVGIY